MTEIDETQPPPAETVPEAASGLGEVAVGEAPTQIPVSTSEQANETDGQDLVANPLTSDQTAELAKQRAENELMWEKTAKERDRHRPLIDRITGDNKTSPMDIAHEEANEVDDRVDMWMDPEWGSYQAETGAEALEKIKENYRNPLEMRDEYDIERDEKRRHAVEKATRSRVEAAIKAIQEGDLAKAGELYGEAVEKIGWDFVGRGRFYKEKLEPVIGNFLDAAFAANKPDQVRAVIESKLFGLVDRYTATVDEEKRRTPEMVQMMEGEVIKVTTDFVRNYYKYSSNGSERRFLRDRLRNLADLGILDAEGMSTSKTIRKATLDEIIEGNTDTDGEVRLNLPNSAWYLERKGLFSKDEYYQHPRIKEQAKELALRNIRHANPDGLLRLVEQGALTKDELLGWPEIEQSAKEAMSYLVEDANETIKGISDGNKHQIDPASACNILLTRITGMENLGILKPEQVEATQGMKETVGKLLELSKQVVVKKKESLVKGAEQAVRQAQDAIGNNALNLSALQQQASKMGLIEKPEEDASLSDASALPQLRQAP